MKKLQVALIAIFTLVCMLAKGQTAPENFSNPIVSGFSPDPSICRVGDDYYLATSSFVWFPAMPVYHSKDLVNWELIGHGLTRPGQVSFNGLQDKSGIWAVTIRYHEGIFYMITNCNGCGDNFYITAKNPAGPWSDPIWIKGASGIDPSLMWDDDGKCYYVGNRWDFKKEWTGQCAIWLQQLDLKQHKLIGKKKILTYGYTRNSPYAEAPHLYKIDGKYLLLTAEGGTDRNHAVVAYHSDRLWGPYAPAKKNPVLTHRLFAEDYPIQAVGHADLVQTQNGDWWAVVLGKRVVNGEVPLSRETFLCKVQFENGIPVFNQGGGKVLSEQQRPDLPWTPFKHEPVRDQFDSDTLASKWHYVRVPEKKFISLAGGELTVDLRPEVVDSLVNTSMLIQKMEHFKFSARTKLSFKTAVENEEAGLIIYRNSESYFMLMKEEANIVLIRKDKGDKQTIAKMPYDDQEVYLSVTVDDLDANFSFGASIDKMTSIGGTQSLKIISESKLNRFNGPGVGVYCTSNGQRTVNQAKFDWFEYKENK